MNDGSRTGRALLLVWAIGAALVGLLSSGLVLYFFLHRGAAPAGGPAAATSFLTLPEDWCQAVTDGLKTARKAPFAGHRTSLGHHARFVVDYLG